MIRSFAPNRKTTYDKGMNNLDAIYVDIDDCHLKANEIKSAFQSWISSLIESTGCNVNAIDGKTARRSFTTKDRKSVLCTVNAWGCHYQLVIRIKSRW